MTLEEEKYFVSQGMRKYGGSFVKALGEALAHADPYNAEKIKNNWSKLWKEYALIGHQIEIAGDMP